jgi:hypothetical protein
MFFTFVFIKSSYLWKPCNRCRYTICGRRYTICGRQNRDANWGYSHNANKDEAASRNHTFEQANNNTRAWTNLMWTSGGNLNPSKCFYYYIKPQYNFNNRLKIIELNGNPKVRYYSLILPQVRLPHSPDMNPLTQSAH